MKLVNIHKPLLLVFILISPTVFAQEWTLEQCIDSATVYNKSLQLRKNQILISEEKVNEAKSNLLPKVNATAEYKYFFDLPYQLMPMEIFGGAEGHFKEAQFGVPHNINANVQAKIPLFNSEIYGAIKSTQIAVDIQQLQYQKAEELVYFELSNLYYNAQILYKQQEFLNNNLSNSKELLDIIKLLNEQGLAKKSDVSKVQLQYNQLFTNRNSTLNKLQQVLNAIKVSIGIPLNSSFEIEKEINTGVVEQDYYSGSSTDILLSTKQNQLVNHQVKVLKQSYLPTLSLFGSYGTTGYGYTSDANDFLNFYPVSFAGFQLNLPIFNGTVTKTKINQKKVELINSRLQISQEKEQNEMLISNGVLQKNNALASMEMTEQQIQLASDVYAESILQQKEGIISLTDVLMAETSLIEAQQNHISAIVDYLKADLELKKLTGLFNSHKN